MALTPATVVASRAGTVVATTAAAAPSIVRVSTGRRFAIAPSSIWSRPKVRGGDRNTATQIAGAVILVKDDRFE